MVKHFASIFVAVLFTFQFLFVNSAEVSAQVPQYKWGKWVPGTPYLAYLFSSQQTPRFQSIFRPADFHAPTGQMDNVYIRLVPNLKKNISVTIYDLQISLGYAPDSVYPASSPQFFQGLTLVFQADSLTTPILDSMGAWLKLPLNRSGFGYISGKNLVVDFSYGSHPNPTYGFGLVGSNNNPYDNLLYGGRGSMSVVRSNSPFEFGFDLATTEVKEFKLNSELNFYPNPTKGAVVLVLDSKETANQLDVSITNMTGQQVFIQQFKKTAPRFSTELDIRSLSKGTYMVQVRDGNQILNSKLLLE